jgi:Lon protease-like protein
VDEIGLFPLGIVLLPGEEIPLHIFEPRYRELIGECLELSREFGLVLADGDGLREVGTVTSVREVLERHDDGRLDIVVRGRSRFRVVQLTSGRSFQTARIEPYEDAADPAGPDEAQRALSLFERLVEMTGSDVDPPEDPESPQLSFDLAARFEFSPPLEQELLQETSERRRLVRLCEMLEGAAAVVAHQQDVSARAATNGKVQPGPA